MVHMLVEKDKNHLQDREGTFIMFHCFNIILSAYAFTKALWKVENELHMCRARLLTEILLKISVRSSKSLEVKEVISAQEILTRPCVRAIILPASRTWESKLWRVQDDDTFFTRMNYSLRLTSNNINNKLLTPPSSFCLSSGCYFRVQNSYVHVLISNAWRDLLEFFE